MFNVVFQHDPVGKEKSNNLSVKREFLQTSIPPLISVLYATGYHNFLSKLFCLTVPKHFVEEPFCVVFQKISGSEKKKFMDRGRGEGGSIKIFRRIFFVSQCRKFRKGTL